MKNFTLLFTMLSVLLISCQNNTKEATTEETPNPTEEKMETPTKVLRHFVVFKFKDDASEEAVQSINDAFNALPDSISAIKDFEWGLNNSGEGLDQGFTHCYMVTFDSKEDLDNIYLPHSAHKAFVESLGDVLEKAFVIDYFTE